MTLDLFEGPIKSFAEQCERSVIQPLPQNFVLPLSRHQKAAIAQALEAISPQFELLEPSMIVVNFFPFFECSVGLHQKKSVAFCTKQKSHLRGENLGSIPALSNCFSIPDIMVVGNELIN